MSPPNSFDSILAEQDGSLPIYEVLPDICRTLSERHELILQASPGAGKTTTVPLALLTLASLNGLKILMLEPRRLAAKAAAERMAQILGEPVGQTVGYRVRLDTKVSASTRIEVITEGILARMLQQDPALEEVGLVIFDEFHERSIDADFGLALCLQVRKLFRHPTEDEQPLKLLVMSATLDDIGLADLLADNGQSAPVVASEGRQYPVTVHYDAPWEPRQNTVARVSSLVIKVLRQHLGSVLVFLPGQGEIRKVQTLLSEALEQNSDLANVRVSPLYGSLSLGEQRRAILSVPEGERKVVLATNLAESSLTIQGVTVVVDSGLTRHAAFDPASGMTRLKTSRVSKASSTQRAGRAGRLAEGHCYRLWSEAQQSQLNPQTVPEIVQADLAALALQLLSWGVSEPNELEWLDPPPQGAYQQALDLLMLLSAVTRNERGHYQVTALGEAMASLSLHPRLAHMLVTAKYIEAMFIKTQSMTTEPMRSEPLALEATAAKLAALLSERDPFSAHEAARAGTDIELRVLELGVSKRPVFKRIAQQARQFEQSLRALGVGSYINSSLNSGINSEIDFGSTEQGFVADDGLLGILLALAYPDRIAQQRGSNSQSYHSQSYHSQSHNSQSQKSQSYVMANGRSARLPDGDPLVQSPMIVVAQVGGHDKAKEDQIFLAAALSAQAFSGPLASLVSEHAVADWDDDRQRFVAEKQKRVGALVLEKEPLETIDPEQKAEVLCQLIRRRGLSLLNIDPELQQWLARVELMRALEPNAEPAWPDMSEQGLLATLEQWLAPYLDQVSHIKHFAQLDMAMILKTCLPWPLPNALDEALPERIQAASGNRHKIDYSHSPPVLAVKLQEMFGETRSPVLAKGRVPLLLHLLSPAKRPLAVTQDLASFWQNAYPDVKKDMKGRYPKHPWPDNPLEANATAKTKRKS